MVWWEWGWGAIVDARCIASFEFSFCVCVCVCARARACVFGVCHWERATAKLQRHHIRNILQKVSAESWADTGAQSRDAEEKSLPHASSGAGGSTTRFSQREAQLIEEYLREVGEAKLMLVRC